MSRCGRPGTAKSNLIELAGIVNERDYTCLRTIGYAVVSRIRELVALSSFGGGFALSFEPGLFSGLVEVELAHALVGNRHGRTAAAEAFGAVGTAPLAQLCGIFLRVQCADLRALFRCLVALAAVAVANVTLLVALEPDEHPLSVFLVVLLILSEHGFTSLHGARAVPQGAAL